MGQSTDRLYRGYGICGTGVFILLVEAPKTQTGTKKLHQFVETTGLTHRKPTFSKYSSGRASVR